MPDDKRGREPQSYGSEADWLSGRTGQKVQNPKSEHPPEHRDFYENRRDGEDSAPAQGGQTSDVQLAESAQPVGQAHGAEQTVTGVTGAESGAKRGSYFKKRDYE